MLDLHTHSCFSDGTDTPAELAAHARQAGLFAVALTDHDSVGGVPAFLEACREQGLSGVAGVEICVTTASGTLHLLGLGIDPAHAGLGATLGEMVQGRDLRNRRILDKLALAGLPIDARDIERLAGQDAIGRPHIAQAMIARGYVRNLQEAFDRYLGKGALAYVDRRRLTPEEGIRLIRDAGGVAIVAHPYTWLADPDALAAALPELMAAGLRGIEAYYSEHTPAMTIDLLRLARRLGLLVTGGSDYHGSTKPDIRLGVGFGRLQVPDALLAPLLAAIGGLPGVFG